VRLTPSMVAALPETASLRTADGVRLSARHDPPLADPPMAEASLADPPLAGAPLAFVVVHGFTGSWRRPDLRAVVERLRRYGGVVSFDLRGHGASAGEASVGATEHADVSAAVAWAGTLGYRTVVTLGFSLGSALVVRQAGLEGGVDAVVAVSGPSRWNYRGTAPTRRLHAGMGTTLGRAVLARAFGTRVGAEGWDPAPLPPDAAAERIAPTPLLVVHGEADDYFPVDHARWLAEAAGPTATLWLVPGMGHAEGAVSGDLLDRIATWAVALVPGTAVPGSVVPVAAPPGEARARPPGSARMRG